MFNSGILATQKSIINRAYRNFSSTTICLLASSKSYDATGAAIMRKIREEATGDVRFIGMGGEEMLDEGLEKTYADVGHMPDKPFIPYKNFLRQHLITEIHPATFWLKKAHRDIIKELTKNNFWHEALEAQPSTYVTLGNYLFMQKVYEGIGGLYLNNGQMKPPTLHYDHLIINQRQEYESFCDYWLYANPRPPQNWAGYKFPSTYVGSMAASSAMTYLLKQSDKTKHLVDKNTLLLSKDPSTMANITDMLVEEERARFRQKHNISEEATLFYGLPGNTEEEIKWCIPLLAQSVDKFLDQYGQYSADNFAIVITSYKKHADLIDKEISKQKWGCRVIVTENDEDKYSALAASDMGAVMNGDAACEAAVYRIPVLVLSNVNWFQAYVTLLYNSFNNNLNIAMNGEVYPELLGQSFAGKIVEYWGLWFDKPYKRYSLVERFNPLTNKLFSEVGGDTLESVVTTKQLQASNIPTEFDRYYQADHLTAKKILDAVRLFEKTKAKQLKHFEFEKERVTLLNALAAE